jgi:phosphate starvation-inducible PhoH-like protein
MADQLRVKVSSNELMVGLLGQRDEYLRVIETAYDVDVVARGNEIALSGPQASEAEHVLNELVLLLESGQQIDTPVVRRAIDMVGNNVRPSEVLTDRVITTARGKPVRPKTAGQKEYLDAIAQNMVTFGIGPAGTGKSWLAVACAVRALQNKEVERIILTRPAVEAGERLGFLPGDLMSKVDPYLRPLYDALHDMVGAEGMAKLFERGSVEVAPLAFMRGRTLNDSFIILDEAQNTTPEQMKMFLTRIGFNSRVVVTGDETQVDVGGGRSGLGGTEAILSGVDNVGFVRLRSKDVVRHRIVQDIVDAYERHTAG